MSTSSAGCEAGSISSSRSSVIERMLAMGRHAEEFVALLVDVTQLGVDVGQLRIGPLEIFVRTVQIDRAIVDFRLQLVSSLLQLT